jgi:hypothetical protein
MEGPEETGAVGVSDHRITHVAQPGVPNARGFLRVVGWRRLGCAGFRGENFLTFSSGLKFAFFRVKFAANRFCSLRGVGFQITGSPAHRITGFF